jgi:hypothetical protein
LELVFYVEYFYMLLSRHQAAAFPACLVHPAHQGAMEFPAVPEPPALLASQDVRQRIFFKEKYSNKAFKEF